MAPHYSGPSHYCGRGPVFDFCAYSWSRSSHHWRRTWDDLQAIRYATLSCQRSGHLALSLSPGTAASRICDPFARVSLAGSGRSLPTSASAWTCERTAFAASYPGGYDQGNGPTNHGRIVLGPQGQDCRPASQRATDCTLTQSARLCLLYALSGMWSSHSMPALRYFLNLSQAWASAQMPLLWLPKPSTWPLS